jgi:sporulation protein YlmC with PRC-barrel domain
MNYINLIAKPVITLYDAILQGCIISGNFTKNFKKLTTLILENENTNSTIDEYQFNTKDAFSFGKDAIIIKNCDVLSVCDYDKNSNLNPLNLRAYAVNGEFLGKVCDVILDENFSVVKFICENNEFTPNQIVSSNEKIMLVDTQNVNIAITKFKPKHKEDNLTATILPYTKVEASQTRSTIIPRANVINNDLIGRTLTQNLVAENGELLARCGSKVTSSILNLAISHQKLRELCFYAK